MKFRIVATPLGYSKQRAQIRGCPVSVVSSSIITKVLTRKRCVTGSRPNGRMKPTNDLCQMLQKKMHRMVRFQMLAFVDQDMPEIVFGPLENETR
jgi:hypothetical protein